MTQHCRIEAAGPAPDVRRAGLKNGVRGLYEGWLQIEQSTMDRMDSYRVENHATFAGGWVAVQQCSWSRPIAPVWTTSERCYVLDLSLDSRKSAATAECLSRGRSTGPVSVGATYMVPPGQTLMLRAKQGQARSLRCLLSADLVERHLPGKPDWSDPKVVSDGMVKLGGGQIEWLLRRMYRELHEPDFATANMMETLAQQLAIEIVRRFKLRECEPTYRVGGLSPWRMRLIEDRVYSDQPMPCLSELAKLCGMTVRHLSRAFRTETGQTVGKYLDAVMAERAKAMLSQNVSVCDVAVKLGYATSGSFSCAFRRSTGLLPREIKALLAA